MGDASIVVMDHDKEAELIASYVAKTLQSFRKLEGALSEPFLARSRNVMDGDTLNEFSFQTQNDFTRFKMWVVNQKAHQSGSASLDYRLREATHLRGQIIYLLKDVCESLKTATSKFHRRIYLLAPRSHKGELQGSSIESSEDDEWDDDESDSPDLDSDQQPTSNTSTLFIDIKEAVDCLLSLSVAIANPAPHERWHKYGAGPSKDLSYEPHDIAYVRDKFPSATDELANALGKSVTLKRQFFTHRKAHHDQFILSEETDTYYAELIQVDALSDDETSQTTSAHHWFLEGPGQATLPSRPSATKDGIFVCPFCYRMICAKTETAWE